MWRSFFMASGIFLILLGLQTLAVDKFKVVKFRKIPASLLSKAKSIGANSGPATPMNYAPPQVPNAIAYQGNNRRPNMGQPSRILQRPGSSGIASAYGPSAYGPTRYSGTQSGSFNRVLNRSSPGMPRLGPAMPTYPIQNPSRRPNVRPAGYQNYPASSGYVSGQPGGGQFALRAPNSNNIYRIINTLDWMPWSLMAAGTVLVLYTRPRNRFDGSE